MQVTVGSSDDLKPELRKKSEFQLWFKDSERGISLSGKEADTAWKNYKMALDPIGEMIRSEEELLRSQEPPDPA